MVGAVLVSIAMVAIGLYLVAVETQLQRQTGQQRPLLRNLGQILVLIGGLCILGAIFG